MTEANGRRRLLDILDLEQIDLKYYRGYTPDTHSIRVFGGQVAGQALVAACRTVEPGKHVHSLHAYFLRPGDPALPILYEVDVIRDGRSFATRRVVAIQKGEAIFNLSASFQHDEEGLSHQVAVLDAPPPDEVPEVDVSNAGPEAVAWWEMMRSRFPLDYRFVDALPGSRRSDDPSPARQRVWLRSAEPLGDDPLMHVCALAYASDLFLISSALLPHRMNLRTSNVTAASLDHAMWFHQRFRADEWLLYDQEGSWTGHGRGLARGQVFNQAGELVATVIQEGLLRSKVREGQP
jgi:acyl-CoA thioesterase II